MKNYHVGILGCGQIAQIMHLPYLHDMPGWTVHSLCDISAEVVQKVAAKYQIPETNCYTDYDRFLEDSELDVVLICSKDHCEPAVKAAKAGKHVFVEKPFGFNLSQAEQMADAAEASGVKMMVGYMKRYDPGFEECLRRIQGKEISLVRFHDFGGSFAHTRTVYDVLSGTDVAPEVFQAGKRANDQAMLQQLGEGKERLLPAYSLLLGVFCHDSILMRHMFGESLEVMFADTNGGFTTAVLRAGNTRIVLESGLVMTRAVWDEHIEIYTPEENLRLDFPWPYLKNVPAKLTVSDSIPNTGMTRESVITASQEEAYRREWVHFHTCITEDKEPLTSGRDAVNDIRLMSRIMDAVR